MANLVVYDSLYGNTQKIAEAIAEAVGGKAVKAADFRKEMLEGVSLLIAGCPIHAWRPSKSMQDFLKSLPADGIKGVNVAAFDTRVKSFISGSASDKVNRQLTMLGGKSAIEPEKFYVKSQEGPLLDGELEKAKAWAIQIFKNVGSK